MDERRYKLFLNIVIYGVAIVSFIQLFGRLLIHPRSAWREWKETKP